MPIRTMNATDLPAIAELHVRGRYGNIKYDSTPIVNYLKLILLENPYFDDRYSSFIWEDSSKRILGFLGVIPRKMSFRGQSITAATGFLANVAPEARRQGIGKALLAAYLSGPQDISISDRATDAFTRIYLSLGGSVSPLDSLSWTLPIKPFSYALSIAKRKSRPINLVSGAVRPVLQYFDSFRKLHIRNYSIKRSFDVDNILQCIQELGDFNSLKMKLDKESAEWLIQILKLGSSVGETNVVFLQDDIGKILGWCLYGIRDEVCNILHIEMRENHEDQFFIELVSFMFNNGVSALSGRASYKLFPQFWKTATFLRGGPSWAVFNTHHTELRQSILRGNSEISRLSGEWWIEFPAYK